MLDTAKGAVFNGVGLPIDHWLRGPLRERAASRLDAQRIAAGGLSDPAPISRRWSEHLSGRRNRRHALWRVPCLMRGPIVTHNPLLSAISPNICQLYPRKRHRQRATTPGLPQKTKADSASATALVTPGRGTEWQSVLTA